MIKELCDAIKGIDDLIKVETKGDDAFIENNKKLNAYCPIYVDGEGGQCIGFGELVNSAFISLLEKFKSINDGKNLENDKLVQYAILWLSYKIKQNPNMENIMLKDFYTKIKENMKYDKHIINNEVYKSYKDNIDKKEDLMNMSINIIFKFYEAFENLCKMYTACNENNKKCTNCLEEATNFAKKYDELNGDPNNIENSSYTQILSTLSNDYENLKKECSNGQSRKFPSLPKIAPKKSSPKKSIESYGQTSIDNSAQVSEGTASSSPIANKLIPGLFIFAAIPVFLGIAYKYSLFGFDKRIHRQYLREKLKKIKKKMSHYI
ncbi:Plasmodium variant antigen protein Cir/Yir/Bir, putative [Plasmodium chabaudi adami]|uniref:Plasmodium variant antigen protein Cir/Yir/Bir, putative n=1 Tax=Plasmodium chabaudi adami TaxID=5826 RepID=A0A1C6WXU7_PLACE|nr:Plasmodium variant antigen protein Cir/Yir/Bir, putative [Plasmodium chabaudi adami]